ncbi:MAG: HelD family protein, partial [Mycobacteriales bacterium]
GLHRAAYLLYTYPDRLTRGGVLVVGPNTAFLSYVSAVLPALGEVGVEQLSVEQLVTGVRVRGTDDPATATLKGDARLARVLRRAVYARISRPAYAVAVTVGTRRFRVQPEQLRHWVDDLRRGELTYGPARTRLAALIAYDVRRQLEAEGATPTDAAVDRIAGLPAVRAAVDQLWPAVNPARLLLGLFTDADRLARAAHGILEEAEQRRLRWSAPPRTPGAARWSAADAFLIDEVAGLLERHPSYGHVIVDEAQDLSPMQCRAIARRSVLGSLTVLGDLAQGTAPWATTDWPQSLTHLGKDDARIEPLTRGYRVPGEVIALANRLLPTIAPGLPMGESVRPGHDALTVVPVESVAVALPGLVRAALRREGTLGIIVADTQARAVRRALERAGVDHALLGEAEHRVMAVPASLAKGLEYDEVIVVEPAQIVAGEPRGLRRLYVVLTRAVSRLVLLHAEPLPDLLTR